MTFVTFPRAAADEAIERVLAGLLFSNVCPSHAKLTKLKDLKIEDLEFLEECSHGGTSSGNVQRRKPSAVIQKQAGMEQMEQTEIPFVP